MPSRGGGRGGRYMTFVEAPEASIESAMVPGAARLEFNNQDDRPRDNNDPESSPCVQHKVDRQLGRQLESKPSNSYLCRLWASDEDCVNCGEREHLISSRDYDNSADNVDEKSRNRGEKSARIKSGRSASNLSSIFGYHIEGASCHNNTRNSRNDPNMKPTFSERYLNIRVIGVLLFILASVFCLYKIYQLNNEPSNHTNNLISTHLKLVSVFNRHGDRAPSDRLAPIDKHSEKADFFWPNGLNKLTALGKLREYRVGLELRRLYGEDIFLDYNASHFLAFSSPIERCIDSLNNTLRGLFDIELTPTYGRKLIDRYNEYRNQTHDGVKYCFNNADEIVHNETYCNQKAAGAAPSHQHPSKRNGAKRNEFVLPSGSGSPSEYKNIDIDTLTVPTLTYQYLNDCKYRLNNPTPVDTNLLNSPAIAQVKGVNKLVKLLKNRYDLDFNFTTLGHWSSISNEVSLARTTQTMMYCDHFADWINLNVPEYAQVKLTLLDLYEYVAVLAYRDRITGVAGRVQLGPILTSLIKSQSVALTYNQYNDKPNSNASLSAEKQARLRQSRLFSGFQMFPNNQSEPEDNVPPPAVAEPARKTFADGDQYKDKKMIIYSTHDSILQLLMHRLGIIRMDPPSLEARIKKWKHSDDENQFLAGYKMSKFGASLVFELHESELRPSDSGEKYRGQDTSKTSTKRFAFVQAALYNQEDGKYKPVEYKRLKIGTSCRRRFQEIHNDLPKSEVSSMLEQFYDPDFPLDKKYSCPHELFKKISSSYMIERDELNKLCF